VPKCHWQAKITMGRPSGSQDTATIRKKCNKAISHPEQISRNHFASLKLCIKIIQEWKGQMFW